MKLIKNTMYALVLVLFLAGIQQANAQLKNPTGGDQAGPAAPLDEGGGTPSTSWQTNPSGLHVNGFTKVGIGTSSPSQKLDIYGTANTFMRVTSEGGANLGSHVAGLSLKRMKAGAGQVTWDIVNQNSFRIRKEGIPVISLDPSEAQFGNINDKMTLDIWGNHIIKNGSKLENGTISIRNAHTGQSHNLRLDGDQIESSTELNINFMSNNNLNLVYGGGKVKVGTLDNEAKFNIASKEEMQLKLTNPGIGGGSWRIGVANSTWAAGAGKLVFSKTASSGDATMVITPAGNVGIGLTTPSRTLHVNGTTRTKVLEITGGADLAEPFEIAGESVVQPGMVVSIDPVHAGQLKMATRAYDKTVAGIVSGAGNINPGMVMGQDGTIANGEHPVALTGRVYCKVDATYGAIQPGDLLTTSDTPGHAMKVTDHTQGQGAIIGKAMTSLEAGQGLVLVLVSLQ